MFVLTVSILALRGGGRGRVLLQDGGVPARSRCLHRSLAAPCPLTKSSRHLSLLIRYMVFVHFGIVFSVADGIEASSDDISNDDVDAVVRESSNGQFNRAR